MAVEAVYEVKVGWDSLPSTILRLDTGTFSGAYTIGSPLYSTFAGAQDTITNDVKRFTTSRGRDDTLDPMRAGSATVTLKDETGKYNAKNPASVLYGRLLPMRPVRIRATYNAVTYGMFYGYIETIDYFPARYESVIVCKDGFVVLDNAYPVIASMGKVKTDAAIDALVRYSEIPSSFWLPVTGAGDYMPDFSTTGSDKALAAIQNLMEVTRGDFFFNRDGVATFKDREVRYANTTPTAIPRGTETQLASGVDLQRVRNHAGARKTPDGELQESTSYESNSAYGYRDFGTVESPYFMDDQHAKSLTSFIVGKRKDAVSTAWNADWTANKSAGLMVAALERELVDVVSISETAVSGNFFVESIEHTVSDGQKLHAVKLGLSERRAQDIGFEIGRSTLGGTDTFTYGDV